MKRLVFFCLALLVASFVAANSTHPTQQAAAASAPTSTPEQIGKAHQCMRLLRSPEAAGLWKHYDASSNGATVEVGPLFYQADYETKGALAKTFQCVLTDGRMDDSYTIIVFVEARTHKDVARFSPGLGLDVLD